MPSVAQFYAANEHRGRAVLAGTATEPYIWLTRIVNRMGHVQFYRCTDLELAPIVQMAPDAEVSRWIGKPRQTPPGRPTGQWAA